MTRTQEDSNPVRAARERAGLTREQAAVKAGLSVSTVYYAEKGFVTEATAAKLAPILGVDPAELRP